MKKVLLTVISVLMAAYLVAASIGLCHRPQTGLCQGVELRVRDSLGYGLLSDEQVLQVLKRNGIQPEGADMTQINLKEIEEVLCRYPLVEAAQCYKTAGDMLKIKVVCRTPLFRVRSADGADYYVDSHGQIIEYSGIALSLPVVTGHVSRYMACHEIKELAESIMSDSFWNNQIEQINVTENHEIQMVPRVGAHLLLLGEARDFSSKLKRLYGFYENGLSVIGWDKYASISVAFDGQIVCRKY